MMMDFKTLPEGPLTLRNVTLPACLLGRDGELIRTDIGIENGRIAALGGTPTAAPGGTPVEMGGAMLLPCFTDMHTHLDKGHIWPRAANPDGSFAGALASVGADRVARWSAEDVYRRADFALRCAFAHGTRAIRTHLDSLAPQDDISWPVFERLREDWAGRIDLQAASLAGCDSVDAQGRYRHTADLVARAGGILGLVTYPMDDLRDRLRAFFDLAGKCGLPVDFHVDETMDPAAETLRLIAETVIETGFDAPVVVGHCCSLSTQGEARAMATLDLVARAGIGVVSLPMCNLYLQDRQVGRTPRRRGVTLVHEMKARGIAVAFASDNTRDPFYAYGDLDMLEVLREATRIAHLDHSDADWLRAVTTTPAEICGFAPAGLAPGDPADLVIFRARNWTELFARPQSDRIVLRAGRAIDRTLPDHAELDDLMETA